MRWEYSTLDIVKALNIPRERLRGWMKEGFIQPTQPAKGQGTKAVFTITDVCIVGLFKKLIEMGYRRESAAGLCDFYSSSLKSQGITMPVGGFIVITHTVSKSGKRYVHFQRTGGKHILFESEKGRFLSGSVDELETDDNFTTYRCIVPHSLKKEDHREDSDKYWDNVLIINFTKLTEDIERALEALG